MSGPSVTVIVPTFDHVETLRLSVPTALAQTMADLEVLVVGDGAPDRSREIVEELAAADGRVRYLSFPKGERNGEAYRHGVLLGEARGEYIFYLGDDDLWLPNHVESLLELMRGTGTNFVCCQPLWVLPDCSAKRWIVDLGLEFYRDELLAGRNRVPLNCAAHTMDLYRALPHGWRTTPKGTPTDLYMWQQLLEHPDCRAASSAQPTVIGVPQSERAGMDPRARVRELEAWSPTSDPAVQARFLRTGYVAEFGSLAHAGLEAGLTTAVQLVEELGAERERLAGVVEEQRAELDTVYASRAWGWAERGRRLRGRVRS